MEPLTEDRENTTPLIKVVQPAQAEASVVQHVQNHASVDEIKASMSSCVVHLCGCN